jgi:hypothetical protein
MPTNTTPPARRLRVRCEQVSGFSLIEALMAMGLLTAALVMLAQLLVMSVRANLSSRDTTYAAVLAEQKVEELRALMFGFDTLGNLVTDLATDTSVAPETPGGGVGLSPSPGLSLGRSTPGYVDYIGLFGNKLGGGREPPAGAVYTRRWSIETLPENPDNALVIQVLVTPNRARGPADRAPVRRLPGEARFVALKVRKKP